MKDKKFEDYENIDMPHEDATNGEIEFNTIEENCDLKEIVICEE